MTEEKKPRRFWIHELTKRYLDGRFHHPLEEKRHEYIEVIEVLPKPKTKFYAYIYESEVSNEEYYLGFFKTTTDKPEFIRAPHLDFEIEE